MNIVRLFNYNVVFKVVINNLFETLKQTKQLTENLSVLR